MVMASSAFSPNKFEPVNHAHDLQQNYMKQLEDNYWGEQQLTKAKKFKIVRAAKLIQKWFRFRLRQKQIIAAVKI